MEFQFICLLIMAIAFLCEYTDSTLGMGYGTILTPVLLIMGYSPLQIVPVILLSEFITGAYAGYCHQKEGNVDFKKPINQKITAILSSCSIIGTIVAVFVAVSLPKIWLKTYIGLLVTCIGLFMLICLNKTFKFTYKKIISLGLLASFNKGMSGGGYGPLVCPGQILSGIKPKTAVAITSVSESLTCLAGIIAYLFISHKTVSWQLAPYIIIGAILSVPLSAKSVKLIPEKWFKLIVAVLTLILGSWTLIKTWLI